MDPNGSFMGSELLFAKCATNEWFQAFDRTDQQLQFKPCFGLAVACDRNLRQNYEKCMTKNEILRSKSLFFLNFLILFWTSK